MHHTNLIYRTSHIFTGAWFVSRAFKPDKQGILICSPPQNSFNKDLNRCSNLCWAQKFLLSLLRTSWTVCELVWFLVKPHQPKLHHPSTTTFTGVHKELVCFEFFGRSKISIEFQNSSLWPLVTLKSTSRTNYHKIHLTNQHSQRHGVIFILRLRICKMQTTKIQNAKHKKQNTKRKGDQRYAISKDSHHRSQIDHRSPYLSIVSFASLKEHWIS